MEKYRVEYIPVRHLSVLWVQAQRPYNEKWAREIAENFDPDKFDPLVVTKPNGEGIYHIIEGQHRRHALEMFAAKFGDKAGNEQAPCRVVDEADPARAAEIWLGINAGRKKIQPITEFLVAVVANREVEVAINRVLTRVGYKVSSRKAKGTISAVAALKIVHGRYGAATLEKTLRAIGGMWSDDPQAVSSPLLRGIGIFINEFGDHVNLRRLKQQVGDRFTPFNFVTAAKTRKGSTLEKTDEAISELMIREYNKGLREDAKIYHKTKKVR
jgi:hypothetical protein